MSLIPHRPKKPTPIFRPEDRSIQADRSRRQAVRGGVSTGFSNLDEFMTIKKGYPLFIAGAPHHGKTQFVKQLLVNLSKLHDWKHCVYLGEDGSIEDITIELVEIYTGKPVRQHDDHGNAVHDAIGDAEFISAFTWVNDHFWIISAETDDVQTFTVYDFYDWVATYEADNGINFDTTVLDPWNDIDTDLSVSGGREDLFLANAFKYLRNVSKKNNRTDIIITHIAAPYSKHRTEKGIRFAAPAEPYEWRGGQEVHRRAFTMLLVYRPPSPDIIKFGKVQIETLVGETWLIVQKSKPRGVGKLGRAILYYDKKSNTYSQRSLTDE